MHPPDNSPTIAMQPTPLPPPSPLQCSPLQISFALYRTTPLADQCVLLAVRDGATALLLLGSCALFWRTKNEHTLEFATFQLVVCVLGALLWFELLALAMVNYALYTAVGKIADACALVFRAFRPCSQVHMHTPTLPAEIATTDPARVRMTSSLGHKKM